MAEMTLSGEEDVATGAQLVPTSKHARKEGAQENFSPPLEKYFKTIEQNFKNLSPSQKTLRPPNILSIHSLQSHMSCSFRLPCQTRASKHDI